MGKLLLKLILVCVLFYVGLNSCGIDVDFVGNGWFIYQLMIVLYITFDFKKIIILIKRNLMDT